MKVKVGLTHNCELLAQESPEDQINYFKYIRFEALLESVLDPCYEGEFDAASIKEGMDSVLDPCHEERSKVVYVEFLSSPHISADTTVKISEDQFEEYRISLPADGLYTYYKLMIYKDTFLEGKYKNKVYFNETDKKIYYNDKEISKIEDLFIYLDKTGSVVDYYEEAIFSLCKLEHCVFKLQQKSLLPLIKYCGKNTCDESKEEKNQRNFLFISLQVLHHLISEEKYGEAEEILKGLSSCNSLCGDLKGNSNCGCN